MARIEKWDEVHGTQAPDERMMAFLCLLYTSRGNRDDLFAGIAFATPDGAGSSGEYQDYDIPGE